MDWAVVVTSAVTGSIFTVVGQIINQTLERRARRDDAAAERRTKIEEAARERQSRRDELALSLAFKIAQERILASRKRNSTDALHQTHRVYLALKSVLDGTGFPIRELVSMSGLAKMRMARDEAEEILEQMKQDGVTITPALRDQVRIETEESYERRYPDVVRKGETVEQAIEREMVDARERLQVEARGEPGGVDPAKEDVSVDPKRS